MQSMTFIRPWTKSPHVLNPIPVYVKFRLYTVALCTTHMDLNSDYLLYFFLFYNILKICLGIVEDL